MGYMNKARPCPLCAGGDSHGHRDLSVRQIRMHKYGRTGREAIPDSSELLGRAFPQLHHL